MAAEEVIDSLVSEGPLSDHWTAVGAVALDAVRSTLTLPAGGWESLGAGSRSQPLGVELELVCWQVGALDHEHPGALRPAQPRQRG